MWCSLHFFYASALLLPETDVAEKPPKEETVVESATPDYAAGLVSTQVILPLLITIQEVITETTLAVLDLLNDGPH